MYILYLICTVFCNFFTFSANVWKWMTPRRRWRRRAYAYSPRATNCLFAYATKNKTKTINMFLIWFVLWDVWLNSCLRGLIGLLYPSYLKHEPVISVLEPCRFKTNVFQEFGSIVRLAWACLEPYSSLSELISILIRTFLRLCGLRK